ncbi:MAG TPA: patatin-like phospholipase family protein [Solirubrobacteraceae bacterium]|nr:patatin-like phospholipase family protein [Solirubrobacteraceae bacterium]
MTGAVTGLAGGPLRGVARALRRERSGVLPGVAAPMARPPEPRLEMLDVRRSLRSPESAGDPVLALVLQRAAAGTRPGARRDPHRLYLAVEGGGMRGAVTAGMGVVLEAAGLTDAFDRIYGVSAGALNGGALAAGQAALAATLYEDVASQHVINRMRPLVRQPLIDFDVLFDELIVARKPLSSEGLAGGPEFRALAVSLQTLTLRVLSGFADAGEVMQAIRASAFLPRLGGGAPQFRDEPMTDGAVLEPIPYESAVAEGATHVLVLRSRPADYRAPRLRAIADSLVVRGEPALATLVRRSRDVYARQAAELAGRGAAHRPRALISQIAVPEGTPLIGRLEASAERAVEAIRVGGGAMARAVLTEPVDLCWQPTVYRRADAEEGAMRGGG